MAKTSVHFKACNVRVSEQHNKREKELDYIRQDLSRYNISHYYDLRPLATIERECAREVKDKTGRKMQKNAVPIYEAVGVIDERTSMADLQRFCEAMRERYGVTPLQIHIHRDEGHPRSKNVREWRSGETTEWKPNLHAHLVFKTIQENGRSKRFTPVHFGEIQTMYAECVHMERGVHTGRKGLSALEFKLQVERQRVLELAQQKIEMKAQLDKDKAELKRVQAKLKAKEKEVAEMRQANPFFIEQFKSVFPKEMKLMGEMVSYDMTIKEMQTLVGGGFVDKTDRWYDASLNKELPEPTKVRFSLDQLREQLLMDGRRIADWFKSKWEALKARMTPKLGIKESEVGIAKDLSGYWYLRHFPSGAKVPVPSDLVKQWQCGDMSKLDVATKLLGSEPEGIKGRGFHM